MPMYDYICLACGKEHEISHSMNETGCRNCPACKEGVLQKQISGGAGIIFKGGGFYATDYKRSGGGSGEESKAGTCSHKSACSCAN